MMEFILVGPKVEKHKVSCSPVMDAEEAEVVMKVKRLAVNQAA
jgi:hypothetical protein